MNRGLVATIVIAGALVAPASADALGGQVAATCKGNDLKPKVAQESARRQATLSDLVTRLQTRRDAFNLNAAQISTLRNAEAGIAALAQQIAGTCYPTGAAFRADVTKLFTNYRIYWLRVPQTHVIEAADHLAEVRARLGAAATKLTQFAGSNEKAQLDLAAFNRSLAAADAKIGTAPKPASSIATVAELQPAADMTSDDAALQAARTDLLAARASLEQARTAAAKVVSDLQG